MSTFTLPTLKRCVLGLAWLGRPASPHPMKSNWVRPMLTPQPHQERYNYARSFSMRILSNSMATTNAALALSKALEGGLIHSVDDSAAIDAPELKGSPYGEARIVKMSSTTKLVPKLSCWVWCCAASQVEPCPIASQKRSGSR